MSNLGDCDDGYASLVNVASTELPAMARIEPGDPALSWVMRKLEGTHDWFSCPGGFCGQQMPLGGPFLSQPTRDAIRIWIADGALNDCP